MDREKGTYSVQSVLKAFDLLEVLASEDSVATIPLLTKRLDLSRNKVFRLLATLEDKGLIERDEPTGTFRHLTIAGPEGTLVVAVAKGEQGLEGHGDEQVSAWLVDADGPERRFEEALISTQYDGEGRPTRAGLELWLGEDSPPTRIACSLLGGTDAVGLWAGLFRCHTDGTEGLGSYLLRRA